MEVSFHAADGQVLGQLSEHRTRKRVLDFDDQLSAIFVGFDDVRPVAAEHADGLMGASFIRHTIDDDGRAPPSWWDR